MARQPSRCSNVQNRSPWQVEARNKPQCNQRFPFNRRADAQAYRDLLTTQGIKAQLVQLETSFQLRVRRKGARVQVITFDTREQAEQARLKIESELSVSIIRDYASAAQTTLRDLMERYSRAPLFHCVISMTPSLNGFWMNQSRGLCWECSILRFIKAGWVIRRHCNC